MNKKAIETLSVNAVRNSIDVCDLLSQYINDNDKGPMLDGYITVYDKCGKKNEDCQGRVNVQVKGKESNDLSKSEISYNVSVSHLTHYMKTSGAILFVVYVNSESQKIYYNALTPIKIKEIISKLKPNQKSVSLKLKAFPDNNKEKEIIVISCCENGKKQASFCDVDIKTIAEYNDENVLEKVVIPITTVKGVNIESAIFSADQSLYAKVKGSNILQPLKDDIEIQSVFKEESVNVAIGDQVYYTEIKRIFTKEQTIIVFGNSFSITISNDKAKRITFNYKDSPMVRTYAKDLAFMNAFVEHKNIMLNGSKLLKDNSFVPSELSNYDLEKRKESLNYAQSIVALLDKLNCKKDLNMDTLTKQDRRYLHYLLDFIIEGNPVKGLKEDLDNILILPVGDLRFLLYFRKIANDTYEIYDLFDSELQFAYENKKGEKIPTSVFFILKSSEFASISNIPYDNILPSIQSFERNEDSMERANLLLLEILNAYDACNNKELLSLANQFAEWIFETEDEQLPYSIRAINYYQAKKRLGNLTDIDKKDLFRIIEETDSQEIKVAANSLLDLFEPAKICFEKLNQNQKDIYMTYPIYRFFPKE